METPLKMPLKIVVGQDGFATVRDADNHRVATDLQPEAAELLARACNTYEQLVATVKVLAQIVYTQNGNLHDDINKILDDARATLAAAGAA